MTAAQLVLTGGSVLVSLDPPRLVTGDVWVEAGRVTRVGGNASGTVSAGGDPGPAEGGEAATRDCSGCLIVPGNVCAHTHLYSSLARGMPNPFAPPRSFLEILQRVWWRLDRGLDEASIRASALVGAADALLAGTTTLIDHHASPNAIDGSLDVIADALAEVGIRSVLSYEVTDRDGDERARAGVRENVRFLARLRHGTYPLARGLVGAHASFTLSEETLAACVEAAATARTGIHIHVAEDDVDESDSGVRFGMRVAARLARAGALNERAILAHAVHVDSHEAAAIDRAGSLVVTNARSNMQNGVGRARLQQFGRLALGTDGIGADMFEESRVAYLRYREETRTADVAWPLARLAEGADYAGQVFGEPALGRIEPGAPADLAVLEYASPTHLDAATVAGHWVFGLGRQAVRDVLVAGELVVADRCLTRLDGDAIAAQGRDEAARLWTRVDGIRPHRFEAPPVAAAAARAQAPSGRKPRSRG